MTTQSKYPLNTEIPLAAKKGRHLFGLIHGQPDKKIARSPNTFANTQGIRYQRNAHPTTGVMTFTQSIVRHRSVFSSFWRWLGRSLEQGRTFNRCEVASEPLKPPVFANKRPLSSVKTRPFVEQAGRLAVAGYQRAESVPLEELLPAARAWLLESADLCELKNDLTAALPYCWTRILVVEIAQLQLFTDAVNTVLLAARWQKN